MKTLIFLVFVVLVVSAMVWKMRKSQAETDLVRRESLERKKKQQQEALKTDNLTWPVIVKPVKGDHASGEDTKTEEPSMTTIEFESPGEITSSQQN